METATLVEDRHTYTPREAFRVLGIGRTLGYSMIADGRLPAVRLSPRKIVIARTAVARLLDEGLSATAQDRESPD